MLHVKHMAFQKTVSCLQFLLCRTVNFLVFIYLCRSSTGKSCSCSDRLQIQNTVTPMAINSGNVPLTPTQGIAPHSDASDWWAAIPRASRYNVGGVEGVYGPQSTPSFRRWCITVTLECRGHCPLSEDDGAGRNASCGALGGHFGRRRLWSAMVVMVVVDRWCQIILIPSWHSYILTADHQKQILPI